MSQSLQVAIDFASLGFSPNLFQIEPFEAFGRTFGPFALRWYSLAYIAGILLGWAYLRRLTREPGAPLTVRHADDFITWATLGIIGGGRLGYVLFYRPEFYLRNPLDILSLWDGGMSFHGGLLGMTIAIIWFARVNGIAPLRLGDYIACVVPIGQAFGRLANFVNAELWGRPTDAPWGVVFPGAEGIARHPSQLYEAAGEGVLLLLVLAWLFFRTDARLKPGLLTGVFVGGFGLARFLIEFFREPDAGIGFGWLGLTRGQILCLPMIAIGVALIAYALTRRGHPRAA